MNSDMSTNMGSSGAGIDESQLVDKKYLNLVQSSYASNANDSVKTQTPTISTALCILGHYQAINAINANDAVMLAPLPLNFNPVMANKLQQQLQLQLNSPAGSPCSTLSLSTVYTDLSDVLLHGSKSAQSTSTYRTDTNDSFADNRDSSNNLDQHEADMGQARKKFPGSNKETFLFYTYML